MHSVVALGVHFCWRKLGLPRANKHEFYTLQAVAYYVVNEKTNGQNR